MDAAYALMVRTFAAIPGKNLLEAIELANESFGIQKSPEAQEAAVEAHNDASMRALTARMAGVKG